MRRSPGPSPASNILLTAALNYAFQTRLCPSVAAGAPHLISFSVREDGCQRNGRYVNKDRVWICLCVDRVINTSSSSPEPQARQPSEVVFRSVEVSHPSRRGSSLHPDLLRRVFKSKAARGRARRKNGASGALARGFGVVQRHCFLTWRV